MEPSTERGIFRSPLLGLLWFPLILGLPEVTYTAAGGRSTAPDLQRWLLITAVPFAGSVLVHAYRLRRATVATQSDGPGRR